MRRFTEEEKKFIAEYAYGHSYLEITEELNRRFDSGISTKQIVAYLKWNKIKTGRTGRFEKGHVPANYRPVGSEFVEKEDKNGIKYIYVKVADPSVWRMKHVVIWEKHYGPIPKGKIIIFLDGNSLNCDIDNLVMIDQATNVVLNKMRLRQDNPEGTKAAINVACLLRKIRQAEKKIN